MADLSVRLKEVRTMRKRKLKEAAACLGIQVRSYQAYESGEREPGVKNLIALADELLCLLLPVLLAFLLLLFPERSRRIALRITM